MYETQFENFGNIIGTNNFLELCMENYPNYLDVVIDFNGSRDDISKVYDLYKNTIWEMIKKSNDIRDEIMLEGKNTVRHDIDLNEAVDIKKVTQNTFEQNEALNPHEERARNIILLQVANLINHYGIEDLLSSQNQISKEIRLGIFEAKADIFISTSELETIKKRLELAENFGEESIPYIENYALLKQRVQSLLDFSKVPRELQQLEVLTRQLTEVDKMLEKKDNHILPLLQSSYEAYEKINREMISTRVGASGNNELLLLHFFPNFKNDSDRSQDEFFEDAVFDYTKSYIESKYGRNFDQAIDSEEAIEIYDQYKASKDSPFDLSLRIPLKNRYTGNHFHNIITKPHTKLSCSICTTDAMHPHLNRKLGIGISSVPINAIKTINLGYNNELDVFSFVNNSVPLPELLEYIKKGRTNETLIDWTKVKPSYIMLVQDDEHIPDDLLVQAKDYSRLSGLPLRIYDTRSQLIEESNSISCNQPIEGAYDVSDLRPFARLKFPKSVFQTIKRIFRNEPTIGGVKNDEYNI